ncbi:hypothetical protein D3C77_513080 [compost metagenome]
MTQQTADNALLDLHAINLKPVSRQQISNNIIVISRIQSDFLTTARFTNRSDDIQRLITVERSHLDRFYPGNFSKLAPKLIAQPLPAHSRLQIKSENGNHLSNRLHALQKRGFIPRIQSSCAH